jgi:hypothetical protein
VDQHLGSSRNSLVLEVEYPAKCTGGGSPYSQPVCNLHSLVGWDLDERAGITLRKDSSSTSGANEDQVAGPGCDRVSIRTDANFSAVGNEQGNGVFLNLDLVPRRTNNRNAPVLGDHAARSQDRILGTKKSEPVEPHEVVTAMLVGFFDGPNYPRGEMAEKVPSARNHVHFTDLPRQDR